MTKEARKGQGAYQCGWNVQYAGKGAMGCDQQRGMYKVVEGYGIHASPYSALSAQEEYIERWI